MRKKLYVVNGRGKEPSLSLQSAFYSLIITLEGQDFKRVSLV